jgi:glucose/arabinose dehydrogenase
MNPSAPAPVALTRLVLATALLAGCGDGSGDVQPPEPVASVTVTAPASVVGIGQTLQLTATALASDGTVLQDRVFEWASADESVATVSDEGLVTGVGEGEVQVTATVEDVGGSLVLTVPAPGEPPPPPPPPPGGPISVGLEEVASGLAFPLYLTSPPGDERLFIVEKGGAIRVVKGGSLLPAPFLDLTGQVATRAEQGLLGLAFPPDYASTGRFFVHYTDVAGDTRVSSFLVSADPDRADAGSETVLVAAEQPGPAHNGGQIAFGPDGFLYIGLGDGGSLDGDDRGRGQSLNDLFGSILRIDVAQGDAYSVPPDNPFVGTAGARPEVWSYGLRNPWRFSFDRSTGDLYIGDVGEKAWEEINRATAAEGAGRGVNYGWSVMEGPDCVGGGSCDRTGLTLPVVAYDHDEGCAVTAGYVYRGSAIPGLQGQYLFADFCQGQVRSFAADGSPTDLTEWPSLEPGGLIPSFGEDASGELYVLSSDGRVLKIVPR